MESENINTRFRRWDYKKKEIEQMIAMFCRKRSAFIWQRFVKLKNSIFLSHRVDLLQRLRLLRPTTPAGIAKCP